MRITRLVLLLAAALPCACLEMPITTLAATGNPVVDTDAGGEEGGPTNPQAACFACLSAPNDPGPGCQTEYDTCTKNSKCNVIINCGFARQCFQGSRKAFLGCGLPCVTNGGVITGDDPTLTLAAGLFQCLSNGPCGDICFSSE